MPERAVAAASRRRRGDGASTPKKNERRRRLAIVASYQGAGRSAEISWRTEGQMHWDVKLRQAFIEWRESKTSKSKLACFTASKCRYGDFFLALFDYLVLHPRALMILSDDDVAWLFPMLHGKDAGRVIGKWIKVRPRRPSNRPHGADRPRGRVVQIFAGTDLVFANAVRRRSVEAAAPPRATTTIFRGGAAAGSAHGCDSGIVGREPDRKVPNVV